MNPRTILAERAYLSLDAETKALVQMDVEECYPSGFEGKRDFMFVLEKGLLWHKPLRNIFYYRCAHSKSRKAFLLARLSDQVLPAVPSVEINTPSIGGGLNILHNTCVIAAERIGEHTSFSQGCVVGKGHGGMPVIEDGVRICANATVFGGITIGKNAIVGAGAVVFEDVPPYSSVAGNPARVIKQRKAEHD